MHVPEWYFLEYISEKLIPRHLTGKDLQAIIIVTCDASELKENFAQTVFSYSILFSRTVGSPTVCGQKTVSALVQDTGAIFSFALTN